MQSIANHRGFLSSLSRSRCFHSSVCIRARRQKQSQVALPQEQLKGIDNSVYTPFKDSDVREAFSMAKDDGGIDATSAGHLLLRRDRQVLYYLRLIENEFPELVSASNLSWNAGLPLIQLFSHPELRKPFTPPTNRPLIVRSIDYAGEKHPVTAKRTVVVAIGQLPLKNVDAVHKFKVLAGVRWTPDPPKDGGVGPRETGREHGFIKISCEDFPQPAQNLKWISDVIDKLIAEANVSAMFCQFALEIYLLLTRIQKRHSQIYHMTYDI